MCICPVPITREWKYRLGTFYTDVVPCGRCHECIAKSQNEFAALAVLEAKKSRSMDFFTFTYSNRFCPVVLSNFDTSHNIVEQSFLSGSERLEYVSAMVRERYDRKGNLIKYLVPIEDDERAVVPSLRREDIKLFLKKTRLAYERKFGRKLSFRYAGFGEYG